MLRPLLFHFFFASDALSVLPFSWLLAINLEPDSLWDTLTIIPSFVRSISKTWTHFFGSLVSLSCNMSPNSKDLQKLFDFLKVVSRVEKSPGFSSLLGLDYVSLKKDQLDYDGSTLKVQLCLTNQLRLPKQDSVSLSTFLAVIDDTTTWALALADPSRSRAGVSVSLKLESGPGASKCSVGDVVQVINRTSKVGRTLGFVEAEVRDAQSNELICSGSHIKYLPMGFLADFALSSYGWPLVKFVSDYALSGQEDGVGQEEKDTLLDDVFDSFHMDDDDDDDKAIFHASSIHSGLGGPLHGGCQAILMELAATKVAKRTLMSKNVQLDSISVEYLSPPNSTDVSIEVEPKQVSADSILARVRLITREKCKGLGTLRFSKSPEQSKV